MLNESYMAINSSEIYTDKAVVFWTALRPP